MTGSLLKRAQLGDEVALATLYDAYFGSLVLYVSAVLGDNREVEDVAQEAFLSGVMSAGRYDETLGPLIAWLLGVARNHATRAMRRGERTLPMDPDDVNRRCVREKTGREAGDATLDDYGDPLLIAALDRLPLAQRQVLFLRFRADLSVRQTAGLLDRSEAAVKMLQHRALGTLRRELGTNRGTESASARYEAIRLARASPVVTSRRLALSWN